MDMKSEGECDAKKGTPGTQDEWKKRRREKKNESNQIISIQSL